MTPGTAQRGALVERTVSRLPGLLPPVALGLAAAGLGSLWPVVGGPVIAVLAGAALSPLVRRRSTTLEPGLATARGFVLQLAVVLLGAGLSFRTVADAGISSLPVLLTTLAACLVLAWLLGRWLGVPGKLRTLIGVGTGICGASAIAAASPVIRARSAEIAYAVSTIFLFNVAAVVVFPPLGHLLGLGQQQFGLFAGTAVNDTSSVVAAATSYGEVATQHAVVVKLVRTLMIIPITLALGAWARRREEGEQRPGGRIRATVTLIPWFLVGFLVMVAANSAGCFSAGAQDGLRTAATLLITVALAAIGLSTDVAALRRAGARPLLLGFLLWVAVATTSLAVQFLTR
ncbi:MAG TPA: YeiH family protein [Jatrophihabitans sp.]|nr:YeiH family protein [Jatrophihabitans sp.]